MRRNKHGGLEEDSIDERVEEDYKKASGDEPCRSIAYRTGSTKPSQYCSTTYQAVRLKERP
jgi:hypothetical protein